MPGQSVVLYRDNVSLGGGVIETVLNRLEKLVREQLHTTSAAGCCPCRRGSGRENGRSSGENRLLPVAFEGIAALFFRLMRPPWKPFTEIFKA